ncbi:MAG: terminase small subunit [Gemmataceae bacterium]|nr:terminase small subunit [Gemmataceae bacterium]
MAAPKTTRRRHKTDRPPLTVREVRFCQAVAVGGNGYRSYLDAGFPPRGTRAATDQAVRRLVRKRQIREYIRKLQQEAADAAMVTVERLAQQLARAAFADRRKLFGADGRLLPPPDWPDDVAACVEGVDVEEGRGEGTGGKSRVRTTKVRTARRAEALRVLAEWTGMIGPEKGKASAAAHPPLVVGGEADPAAL